MRPDPTLKMRSACAETVSACRCCASSFRTPVLTFCRCRRVPSNMLRATAAGASASRCIRAPTAHDGLLHEPTSLELGGQQQGYGHASIKSCEPCYYNAAVDLSLQGAAEHRRSHRLQAHGRGTSGRTSNPSKAELSTTGAFDLPPQQQAVSSTRLYFTRLDSKSSRAGISCAGAHQTPPY